MFNYYPNLIFSLLFWPALVIGLVIALVAYIARRRRKVYLQGESRFLRIAFSREDALSQLYFLLFLAFAGISLLAINRQMGDLVSWRTILFLVSAGGIWLGYRYKALYMLAVSIVSFISWWVIQAATWTERYQVKSAPILAGLILLGLIMYVAGHLHEQNVKWKRFSMIYIIFALIFMSGLLFFYSTRAGLESFGQVLQGGSLVASWELMLSLIVFLVSLGVCFYLAMARHLISLPEALAVVLFGLFALVAIFLPSKPFYIGSNYGFTYYSSSQELSPIGAFWAVVFNIGVFLEMLGIILVGYIRKESWHITLGVVLLFLLILVKYFDWFFTFMDKSLFFIGAGILMFAVGWLMERTRKRVLQSMNQVPNIPHPKTNA